MSVTVRCGAMLMTAALLLGCRQQSDDAPARAPATAQPHAGPATAAATPEDRALDALARRLRSDGVYPDGCVAFVAETPDPDAGEGAFEFAARERHGNGCPGDPQTSPVRDRYRVARDGTLSWYDVVNDEYVDYAQRRRADD